MDYEKKYKEALDRARTFSQRWQGIEATDSELALQELKEIFPELKMSDDERMIRTLREGFNILDKDDEWYSGITNGQILAWLEKQGVQKSADKVEPKFKVGDWVVHCNEDVDLIMGVGKTGYIINKGGGYIPFVCEDDMHLWTIEDAKDGDVLTDGKPFIFKSIDVNKHSYAYCGLSVDNAFIIESEGEYGEWTWIQDIKPAPKEQRDLLKKKMKEAGYEWDGEKKELKKIEQKTAEWSEEDEKERKRVVGLLEGWLYTFKETCYAEDCKCGISWLKSLKRTVKIN